MVNPTVEPTDIRWARLQDELERVYTTEPTFAHAREVAGGGDKMAERAVNEIRETFEHGQRYDWMKANSVVLGPAVTRLFGFKTTKEWREAWAK